MDALSDVLKAVRLTGAVFFDVRASDPWVAETPPPRLQDVDRRGSEPVAAAATIMRLTAGLAIALALLAPAGQLIAHHGGTLTFDQTKPIVLTGTIVSLEWQYPHMGFALETREADGSVALWTFVLEGSNNLVRRGWKRTTLKLGDVVAVRGFAAKDRSFAGNAIAVTRPDGRSVVPPAATPRPQ
jgi:hypothetical protein